MDTSDPQSLQSALTKMYHFAATQARQSPNPVLQTIFENLPALTAQSTPLSTPDLTTLQGEFGQPNWPKFLVSMMIKFQSPLAPSFWIGAAQPAGWPRMLTLNYSPDAQFGATPTPPLATIGLAVMDPGEKQGIWVSLTGSFYHDIPYPPKRRLAVNLTADGTGAGPWTWEFPFDGPFTNTAPPNVSAQATVSWTPGWTGSQTPAYALTLGGLTASVAVSSAEPTFELKLGLGPLAGTLHPQQALGAGLASMLPKVGDIGVRYAPSLVIEQGIPPTFSLNG